jgi:phosphatidylglycerol---prolipoprotein diacylglyceryl transferase
MQRTLFDIGGYAIKAYPVILAMTVLIGSLYITLLNRTRGNAPDITPLIDPYCVVMGLVGARLFYIIQCGVSFENGWRIFFNEGLVFYGGLFGGILAMIIYALVWRIPVMYMMDLGVATVALGEAFQRLGCFLNGCCWGAVSHAPWTIRFPRLSFAWRQHVREGWLSTSAEWSLPVHPTQLYMSFGLVIIAISLFLIFQKTTRHGMVCAAYFMLYPVLRFPVEWLRGDTAYPALGLSVSQINCFE